MSLVPFVAETAAEALERIQAQLGPEAVVVNVRRLPPKGLSRLWKRHGAVEVLASVNDPALVAESEPSLAPSATAQNAPRLATGAGGHLWSRGAELLARMGLLPAHIERIMQHVVTLYGEAPPESALEEGAMVCAALAQCWRPPAQSAVAGMRPHVFIGPPGSGKTTALCKWLTHAVLLEGRNARVWRLDAASANTAESLSVYGEILGVPVHRFWSGDDLGDGETLHLVDLPGVDARDAAAVADLGERLRQFPAPHLHVVLNAAYEIPLLLAQARALAPLNPADLILTHLDEEARWSKLWNLVLGTNYSVRFLGAGQNIPGQFLSAHPEHLLPASFAPN